MLVAHGVLFDEKIIVCGLLIAWSMLVSVTALASEEAVEREVEPMEHGTMYIVEDAEKLMVYTVYENGLVTFAFSFNNDEEVRFLGRINIETEMDPVDIETLILNCEAYEIDHCNEEKVLISPLLDVGDEEDALEACENKYANDWMAPTDSDTWLGAKTVSGVRADLYKGVSAYADLQGYVTYRVRDSLDDVIQAGIKAFKFNGDYTLSMKKAMIKKVLPIAFESTLGYYLQENGSLKYYHVENVATKWVEIDNDTWFYAAKEFRYDVVMVYDAEVKQYYAEAHNDYDNSNTYFWDTAIANYNDQ